MHKDLLKVQIVLNLEHLPSNFGFQAKILEDPTKKMIYPK